jgi:hypothetical protein
MLVAILIALVTLPNGEIHQYNEKAWQGDKATQQCVRVLQNTPKSANINFQCITIKKD